MEQHQATGGTMHAGMPVYLVAAALFLLGCALFFFGSLIATKRSGYALASACPVPEGVMYGSGVHPSEVQEQEVYFVGCGGFF